MLLEVAIVLSSHREYPFQLPVWKPYKISYDTVWNLARGRMRELAHQNDTLAGQIKTAREQVMCKISQANLEANGYDTDENLPSVCNAERALHNGSREAFRKWMGGTVLEVPCAHVQMWQMVYFKYLI